MAGIKKEKAAKIMPQYKPRYFFAKSKKYVIAVYDNPKGMVMVNAYDLQGKFISWGNEPKDNTEKILKNLIQINNDEFVAVMSRRKLSTVK